MASRVKEFAPSQPTTNFRPQGAGGSAAGFRAVESHAVFILFEADRLASGQHGDARVARHAVLQHLFQRRLMEAVVDIPAVGAEHLGPRPGDQHVVRAVDEIDALADSGDFLHRPGETDRLEDAHDLVVEGDRARQMVGRLLALDDDGPDAVAAENIRQRTAHRAEPDDGDVAGFARVHGEERLCRSAGQPVRTSSPIIQRA